MNINGIKMVSSQKIFSSKMKKPFGTIDSQRSARLHELKDMEYFKQNLKGTNDFPMKEILQNFIHRIIVKDLDHSSFIYLPQKNLEGLQCGVPIDDSVMELQKRTGIIRVSKRIDTILRYLMKIQIPVLNKLKHHEKFQFLNLTSFQEYAFNRAIIQSFDQAKGIFFILEGSVRIQESQKGKDIKNLAAGHFLGLKQLYEQKTHFSESVYSTHNKTKILFIGPEALSFNFLDDEITIRDAFKEYYVGKKTKQSSFEEQKKKQEEKVLNILRLKSTNGQNSVNKDIKIMDFSKKYEDFSDKTTVSDKGFNEYIRKKKILLKLKESMQVYKEKKNSEKKSPYSALIKSKKNYTHAKSEESENYQNKQVDTVLPKNLKRRDILSHGLKRKLIELYQYKQTQKQNMKDIQEGFRVTTRS